MAHLATLDAWSEIVSFTEFGTEAGQAHGLVADAGTAWVHKEDRW